MSQVYVLRIYIICLVWEWKDDSEMWLTALWSQVLAEAYNLSPQKNTDDTQVLQSD